MAKKAAKKKPRAKTKRPAKKKLPGARTEWVSIADIGNVVLSVNQVANVSIYPVTE
jgi:hypothetical protein